MSAASGGNSEPKQGQRSQSARGFCPRSTMRVPQPDIIEHFGNADAVPQLPERCLSRKAGIVRCCLKLLGRAGTLTCRLTGVRHTESGCRGLRGGSQLFVRLFRRLHSKAAVRLGGHGHRAVQVGAVKVNALILHFLDDLAVGVAVIIV